MGFNSAFKELNDRAVHNLGSFCFTDDAKGAKCAKWSRLWGLRVCQDCAKTGLNKKINYQFEELKLVDLHIFCTVNW